MAVQALQVGAKKPQGLDQSRGIIAQVFGLLAEKNYTGLISYEAPNPVLWERSPYEVTREGVVLTQELLKAAVASYQA